MKIKGPASSRDEAKTIERSGRHQNDTGYRFALPKHSYFKVSTKSRYICLTSATSALSSSTNSLFSPSISSVV
jgi:hypothetical protein